MDPFAPRQISDRATPIDITGHHVPWTEDSPVYVRTTGCDDLFVPIFSSVDLLHRRMSEFGIDYGSIKHIDDPSDFLASFPYAISGHDWHPDGSAAPSDREMRIRFMIDPWPTDSGTIRFQEIVIQPRN